MNYTFLSQNQGTKLGIAFQDSIRLKHFELARAVLNQFPENERIKNLQSLLVKPETPLDVKSFCASELPHWKRVEYDFRLFEFQLLVKALLCESVISMQEAVKLDRFFNQVLRKVTSKKMIVYTTKPFVAQSKGEQEEDAEESDSSDDELSDVSIWEILTPTVAKVMAQSIVSAQFLCKLISSVDDNKTYKLDLLQFHVQYVLKNGKDLGIGNSVKVLNFIDVNSAKDLTPALVTQIDTCLFLLVDMVTSSSEGGKGGGSEEEGEPIFTGRYLGSRFNELLTSRRSDVKSYLDFRKLKKTHFLQTEIDDLLKKVRKQELGKVGVFFQRNPEFNRLKPLLLMMVFDENKNKLDYLDKVFTILLPHKSEFKKDDLMEETPREIELLPEVCKLHFYLTFSQWFADVIVDLGPDLPALPAEYKKNVSEGHEGFTSEKVRQTVFNKLLGGESICGLVLPFVNFVPQRELLKKLETSELDNERDVKMIKMYYFLNKFIHVESSGGGGGGDEKGSGGDDSKEEEDHQWADESVFEDDVRYKLVLFENIYSLLFVKCGRNSRSMNLGGGGESSSSSSGQGGGGVIDFKFNSQLKYVMKVVQTMLKTVANWRFLSKEPQQEQSKEDENMHKLKVRMGVFLEKMNSVLYRLQLIEKFGKNDGIVNMLVSDARAFLIIALRRNDFELARQIRVKFQLSTDLDILIRKEEAFFHKQDFDVSGEGAEKWDLLFRYYFDLAIMRNLDEKVVKNARKWVEKSLADGKGEDGLGEAGKFLEKITKCDLLLEMKDEKKKNVLKKSYAFLANILSRDIGTLISSQFDDSSGGGGGGEGNDKVGGDSGEDFHYVYLKKFVAHLKKNSEVLNEKNILQEGIKKTVGKLVFKMKKFEKAKELAFINQLDLMQILWKTLLKQEKSKSVQKLTPSSNQVGESPSPSQTPDTPNPEDEEEIEFLLDLEIFIFMYVENNILGALMFVLLRQRDNEEIRKYLMENCSRYPVLFNWLNYLFSTSSGPNMEIGGSPKEKKSSGSPGLGAKLPMEKEKAFKKIIQEHIMKGDLFKALDLSNQINDSNFNDVIITAIIIRDVNQISEYIYRVQDKELVFDLVMKHFNQIEDIALVIELFQLAHDVSDVSKKPQFSSSLQRLSEGYGGGKKKKESNAEVCKKKLKELFIYKDVLAVLNYPSWKEASMKMINNQVSELISQLNKLNQFDLSKRILAFFEPKNHELYLKVEQEYLLSKLEKTDLDHTKILHILVNYDETDAYVICEGLLEQKDLSYEKKIFICNYIITALRSKLSKVEIALYENRLIGLKVFMIICKTKSHMDAEEKFKHLIDMPHLIVENLIMSKEISLINDILKEIGMDVLFKKETDDMFLKYGLKALKVNQNEDVAILELGGTHSSKIMQSVLGDEQSNKNEDDDDDQSSGGTSFFYLNGNEKEDELIRRKFQFDNTPDLVLAKSLMDLVKEPRRTSKMLMKFISNIKFDLSIFSHLKLIELIEKLLQYSKFCLLKDPEGHEEFVEFERVREKFQVLKILLFVKCLKVKQLCINDLMEKNKIRQIRDQLVKGDELKKALKISRMTGIEISPVLVETGIKFLKLNLFQEARSKFEECFEFSRKREFGEFGTLNKEKILRDILAVLENKFVILHKPNSFKDMKESIIEEARYYLEKYGNKDYLRFFLKLNDTKSILNHLFVEDVDQPYFMSVVLPYLYNYGELQTFRKMLEESDKTKEKKAMDAKKKNRYLLTICKFLSSKGAFYLLYEFQLYMKDEMRCGLTCIKMFLNEKDRRKELLEKAKSHFLKTMQHRTIGRNMNIQRNKSSRTLKNVNVMKNLRKINLQLELENVLAIPEKTLFHNFQAKCEIVQILVLNGHHQLAFKIMAEYTLPAVRLYKDILRTAVKSKSVKEMDKLLKMILRSIQLNEKEKDAIVESLIHFYVNENKYKHAERFIGWVKNSSTRVRACLVCKRYKTAFKIASENANSSDVKFIYQHLQNIESKEASSVKDYCIKWLSQNLPS